MIHLSSWWACNLTAARHTQERGGSVHALREQLSTSVVIDGGRLDGSKRNRQLVRQSRTSF